jgi:hypothetical protein
MGLSIAFHEIVVIIRVYLKSTTAPAKRVQIDQATD